MRDFIASRVKNKGLNLGQQLTDKARALNYPDTIYLSIGIPSEGMDEKLKTAAIQSISDNKNSYPPIQGIPALREKIASRYTHHNRADNIVITTGVSEAVAAAIGSIINPGDEVIIPSPSYFIFPELTELWSGSPVYVPLQETNGQWELDCNEVEKRITPKTKLFILNSPHNPTGWIANKKTIEELVRLAELHDFLILSDEVYKKFLYDSEFTSPESLSRRVIVVNGISKSHAATGLRLGWISAPQEIAVAATTMHQYLVLTAPSTPQHAFLHLADTDLRERAKWVSTTYHSRRDSLLSALADCPHLHCIAPAGAFYVFAKFESPKNSLQIAEELLATQHLVVVPGRDYGMEWDSYIRISFALPEETLKEAASRLQNYFSSQS